MPLNITNAPQAKPFCFRERCVTVIDRSRYYGHREVDSADRSTALRNNSQPQDSSGYSTDVFTDAAIAFIRAHATQPFFVEVAYNAALPPYTPPARDAATGLALEAGDPMVTSRRCLPCGPTAVL